jgi:hypothetical protein
VNWLEAYLLDCIQRNVCTKVGCTTCGAREFRTGLLAETAKQMHSLHLSRLTPASAAFIGQALAGVAPRDGVPDERLESAVRLILTDVWATLGESNAERTIAPLLSGSSCGDLLLRMQRHHAAAVTRRREANGDQASAGCVLPGSEPLRRRGE